jgi:hypothetical protein
MQSVDAAISYASRAGLHLPAEQAGVVTAKPSIRFVEENTSAGSECA